MATLRGAALGATVDRARHGALTLREAACEIAVLRVAGDAARAGYLDGDDVPLD